MEISKLDSRVSSGIRSTIVLDRRFASYVISLLPSIAVPSGHSYGSIASLYRAVGQAEDSGRRMGMHNDFIYFNETHFSRIL